MSLNQPYLIDDDDEGDGYTYGGGDSDGDLLDYEGSEPEFISVRSFTTPPTPSSTGPHASVQARNEHSKLHSVRLPDVEIQRARLSGGTTVRPGDTLELVEYSTPSSGTMHSGDFLYVRTIIKNLETDEIRFRGHRMRRTKYLGQIFDWKLNELCIVLFVEEGDTRCPFVAGLEDVGMNEVLRLRECALTNKPYPFLSFRDGGCSAFPANMSESEIRRQIYHGGRLACRVVSIRFMHKKNSSTTATQTPRSGIVRHLYSHEASTPSPSSSSSSSGSLVEGSSREASIIIEDDDDNDLVLVSTNKRRARSDSVEILDESPRKRSLPHPIRDHRYTFGDVFCGVGGASQGARQAGLYMRWGLDADMPALQAYRQNHPGASAFLCNAHHFPPPGQTKDDLRVDILHLSPPCCFFSPAHTVQGPNDQANYEAIYTVGPILSKVKPRVATLEQTFGLASHAQHMKNFYMLLNDIGKAGYDARYKIQYLSKHGLVQQRKRLLIIAARRGTPLPPFPKETHGPPGSGLKPFVTIAKTLHTLERMGSRATPDPYHIPKPFPEPREPTNPNEPLKRCITTGGSESYHYSGTRNWTVRELSLFQSFPYGYSFTGSKTEATKQVGNAFPPVMAEAMYRTIVATLEAFDKGLVSAEEDVTDLEEVLRQKGARRITMSQAAPRESRSLFSPMRQYSLPLRQTLEGRPASSFERGSTTPRLHTSRTATQTSTPPTDFFSGPVDSIGPPTTPPCRPSHRNHRVHPWSATEKDDTVELSD
ncbi:hypothetical protein NX059_008501 [Plenodomus lindquistii]|nr:hypothetical protein NX059_008501 [Plenodomus lindquistii]